MSEQNKQSGKNNEPPSNATESGYLTNQASEASAAIARAFAELKNDLVRGVDPATLAKRYPWAAVGAAAVAGFAAASAVVPSKEQQALKKLERIEKALRPYPSVHEYAVPPAAAGAQASQNKGIMGRLMSELYSAMKPALASALAAYAAAPSEDGDGKKSNGHTASAAAAGNAVYYQQEQDPEQQQQQSAGS